MILVRRRSLSAWRQMRANSASSQNAHGFYGRESHTEYLAVRRNDEGRLIAIKIVGDANVPRGNPTWRSPSGLP